MNLSINANLVLAMIYLSNQDCPSHSHSNTTQDLATNFPYFQSFHSSKVTMYLPVSLLLIASLTSGVLGLPSRIPARDNTASLTLQQQLELAGTAVNRLALLPNDQDFLFDFNTATQGIVQGKGIVHLYYYCYIFLLSHGPL